MTNLQHVAQIWADVKGYEGLYQVSTDGVIRSLPKIRIIKGFKQYYPIKDLIQSKSKNGYLLVTLWKDGVKKVIGVHRIIAETFIPNNSCLEQVNHINGNKVDNRIENLEWVSRSENIAHAIKLGLFRRKKRERP